MTPAAFVDLTGDGQVDIAVVSFDGVVWALDGISGKLLWNYSIPNGESYKYRSIFRRMLLGKIADNNDIYIIFILSLICSICENIFSHFILVSHCAL